jgi:hypothetical protein
MKKSCEKCVVPKRMCSLRELFAKGINRLRTDKLGDFKSIEDFDHKIDACLSSICRVYFPNTSEKKQSDNLI